MAHLEDNTVLVAKKRKGFVYHSLEKLRGRREVFTTDQWDS